MSANEPARPPEDRIVHRDRGAAGHQRPVDADGSESLQIVLIGAIGDRIANAILLQCRHARAYGLGAGLEILVPNQADAVARLLLQHPYQVGIAHRRQRIEALRRFRDDLVEGKEVALKHRALHLGKGRAECREVSTQPVGKKVGAGTYIAVPGRIEGRAVFEEQLPRRSLREQIGGARKGPHRRVLRRDARLEADDDCIDAGQVFRRGKTRQHARADARAHENGSEFEAPGEIVGDGAKYERHARIGN